MSKIISDACINFLNSISVTVPDKYVLDANLRDLFEGSYSMDADALKVHTAILFDKLTARALQLITRINQNALPDDILSLKHILALVSPGKIEYLLPTMMSIAYKLMSDTNAIAMAVKLWKFCNGYQDCSTRILLCDPKLRKSLFKDESYAFNWKKFMQMESFIMADVLQFRLHANDDELRRYGYLPHIPDDICKNHRPVKMRKYLRLTA